jgi:hypothetical protein
MFVSLAVAITSLQAHDGAFTWVGLHNVMEVQLNVRVRMAIR